MCYNDIMSEETKPKSKVKGIKFFKLKLKTKEGFIWKIVSEPYIRYIPENLIFDKQIYDGRN